MFYVILCDAILLQNFSAADIIHQDRCNQHDTDQQLLPVGRNTHQLKAIREDGHDERADHRADDRALAAEQARAADDGRGDGVHFVAVASGGNTAVQTADHDDAGHSGHKAADQIDENQVTLHLDAGEFSRDFVAADRIGIAAKARLVEDERPEHDHGDHHHEDHNHDNHHHEEHHHHEHRNPEDMIHIIGHASMTDSARELACKIVKILANAEAKAHGVPLEQVHFHEVGAVDSIVDIVAAAVCADSLNFDEVYIPQLNEGRGMVRCQHGLLPIPVPAVANIITDHHLKLHITNVEGELVTPTGAAIAAALRTSEQLPEQFVIEKVGMGAGKREYECVGILRAMMIA